MAPAAPEKFPDWDVFKKSIRIASVRQHQLLRYTVAYVGTIIGTPDVAIFSWPFKDEVDLRDDGHLRRIKEHLIAVIELKVSASVTAERNYYQGVTETIVAGLQLGLPREVVGAVYSMHPDATRAYTTTLGPDLVETVLLDEARAMSAFFEAIYERLPTERADDGRVCWHPDIPSRERTAAVPRTWAPSVNDDMSEED